MSTESIRPSAVDGSDPPFPLPVVNTDGTEFNLILRRFRPTSAPPKPPAGDEPRAVLLIHGASANSQTFRVPHGGLVDYLRRRGREVWTLDWRGSCDVVGSLPSTTFINGSFAAECAVFSLDNVAEVDFVLALAFIRKNLEERGVSADRPGSVAVVAHCFGSGALAMAIARGKIEGVKNVVLSTLGLFYEVPWNGWTKAEDFLMERIIAKAARSSAPAADRRAIDAKDTPSHRPAPGAASERWPADMLRDFRLWPASWLPSKAQPSDRIFQGLSFMFGRPYQRQRVPADLDLAKLFGGMHLGLYIHAEQLVRRGFSDRLNAPDVPARAGARRPLGSGVHGDLNPVHFLDKRVTLITGAQNQLWHRDSIDRMYDWLRNQPCQHYPVKRIRPGYAHQDLLWGKTEPETGSVVYDWIEEGISRSDAPR